MADIDKSDKKAYRGAVEVFMTDSKFCVVDEQDANTVKQLEWHNSPRGAFAKINNKQVFMHLLIAQKTNFRRVKSVKHKNHNRYDNRRLNLQVTTEEGPVTDIELGLISAFNKEVYSACNASMTVTGRFSSHDQLPLHYVPMKKPGSSRLRDLFCQFCQNGPALPEQKKESLLLIDSELDKTQKTNEVRGQPQVFAHLDDVSKFASVVPGPIDSFSTYMDWKGVIRLSPAFLSLEASSFEERAKLLKTLGIEYDQSSMVVIDSYAEKFGGHYLCLSKKGTTGKAARLVQLNETVVISLQGDSIEDLELLSKELEKFFEVKTLSEACIK